LFIGDTEFAGPENDRPENNNSWKMQDLENDTPEAANNDIV